MKELRELNVSSISQKSILFLCILMIGLMLAACCSKKDRVFERAFVNVEKDGEFPLKRDYFGNPYYGKTNITFRFKTNSDKLEIKSSILGEIGVNFSCISDSAGVLLLFKTKKGKSK